MSAEGDTSEPRKKTIAASKETKHAEEVKSTDQPAPRNKPDNDQTKPAAKASKPQPDRTEVTRRAFIARSSSAAFIAGAGLGSVCGYISTRQNTRPDTAAPQTETPQPSPNETQFDPSTPPGQRGAIRQRLISQRYNEASALAPQETNDDTEQYADERYYASFTKTLPCNDIGEVQPDAFKTLLTALTSGSPDDFDQITTSTYDERGLANPQGAFKETLDAGAGDTTRIAASWPIDSAELAGEMVEVYWHALTRDVPFARYDDHPDTNAAVNDLNRLSATPGPHRRTTPTDLFRGETPGDLVGPYASQFLLQNFSFGSIDVEQRYSTPVAGVDYLKGRSSWLAVQRGEQPGANVTLETDKRYIYNGRSLGEFVHRDVTCQAYLHAGLILLGLGPVAFDPANPYQNQLQGQGPFVSLGGPFLLDLVMRSANLALSAAWFQKWRAHMTLRPEALGGRVEFNLADERSYDLHPDLTDSAAVAQLLTANGTALLPLAYPEGSPTHPSYPAGHACIAGSGVTVLKAFFDEDFVLPNPVLPTDDGRALAAYGESELTIGGELNKLAANMSLGRDIAGVHYRQDSIQGLEAGEQQAITLLREQSLAPTEKGFEGFGFTAFDGSKVTIVDGDVDRSSD